MAAQKGKSLLLKINTTGSTYVTIGGLRSTSVSLNDEMVDITNKDSSNVREILAGAGVNSITISGSGVFTDSAAETTIKDKMGSATFSNYQLIIPA
jgi:TP901-1 family phage major tail protein